MCDASGVRGGLCAMPERKTIERAREDKREGKASSTQAGEFVREEIHHVREGKHGARSAKQAIAIGLSKARRAGVDLPPQQGGTAKTRRAESRDLAKGMSSKKGAQPSRRRSRATSAALRREGKTAASSAALGRHASSAARKRSAGSRSASAKRAARTRRRRS
jgi:hypothetical protein